MSKENGGCDQYQAGAMALVDHLPHDKLADEKSSSNLVCSYCLVLASVCTGHLRAKAPDYVIRHIDVLDLSELITCTTCLIRQ